MILSHDEITPAVLTELLTASGVAAGAEVVSFESASVGTSQVGENVRYRLTWSTEPGDRPASVVGKFPALDEKSRATPSPLAETVSRVESDATRSNPGRDQVTA